MIGEGKTAPEFSLPAVVDGEVTEVALEDYLGDDIVVLAFYPADFNPCCAGETTDLDELDLFTMQKDVSILGISADSVYAHRAFAEEYDLHVPLLADVHAEVAEAYGVAVADASGGYLTNRAVVVIDPGGEIQYAWQTEKLDRLPPVDDVREAVDDIGGSGTAQARYRVGHAHYVEGRRAFTTAMGEFEEMEWMLAQNDFTRAEEEFAEAADQFNTAVRFAEEEQSQTYFERAEQKAEALWQAAEWLAESASAYASGEGAKGEEMRTDAEGPLETARDIHEPPDPDEFPPEEDPAEQDEQESLLPTDDDGPVASLDTDLDGETPEAEQLADEMAGGDAGTDAAAEPTAAADGTAAQTETDTADDGDSEEIDDEELEEIAAELEDQTRQAEQERAADSDDGTDDTLVEPPENVDDATTAETETGDAPATDDASSDPDAEEVEGKLDEEDIELDLADPTEGTEHEPDEATDGEASDGDTDDEASAETEDAEGDDHGVPDSL